MLVDQLCDSDRQFVVASGDERGTTCDRANTDFHTAAADGNANPAAADRHADAGPAADRHADAEPAD
jgi:hypothetical protein